jgi:3-deoxy-manno-octulosonate cytidylyltransferase (CMP-KDO synthetase)
MKHKEYNMHQILVIIPARYGSTRFPGKALVEIKGEPMVWQVYLRAMEAGLKNICVATDDSSIFDAVKAKGGNVIMTKSTHLSGTDRCAEVLEIYPSQGNFDFVVNLQGDEPFIDPRQILELCNGLKKNKITTLVKKIEKKEQLNNPNCVKAVWSKITGEALYFSRYPIPFLRSEEQSDLERQVYYKHIGIYGFDANILKELVKLPPSPLELSESLEQLRWLENGYRISVCETEYESIGIDSPEDLKALNNYLNIGKKNLD